jgi:hypothetical protein
MAMATAMYYSGYDPFTLKPVSTVRSLREKRQMKALVLYWDPQHWPLAREALQRAGRSDLIGSGPHCLVPLPERVSLAAVPAARAQRGAPAKAGGTAQRRPRSIAFRKERSPSGLS